jgi:hypothetical protein
MRGVRFLVWHNDAVTASAWKGGSYGLGIKKPDTAIFFSRQWKNVEIKIDRRFHSFPLRPTFWDKCPEFRGGALADWILALGITSWPKGRPSQFSLTPLVRNRFQLSI